jgi:integrase
MLVDLSADAGVYIRCHALRRGLARRARVAGLDLGETMALLNHSDPTMTRIYTGDGESEAMISAYRERLG